MNKRQMATARSDGFGLVGKEFPIPTVLATEVITAAWLTYQRLGAANRSHREIVSDPVWQEGHDPSGMRQQGDVILPSLFSTVQENLLHHLRPEMIDLRVPLEITVEVRERAAADADLIRQHALFKTLAETADQFLADMGRALSQPEINMSQIKRCCYMHTMAEQIRTVHTAEAAMTNAKDEHLAPIGHTAKVTATVLSCRFSKEWNTYNHSCITEDGIMISFFNKTKHEFMDTLIIEGKVKDHRKVWGRTDLAETRMNYVKILGRDAGQAS